jgi:hypothetical protein
MKIEISYRPTTKDYIWNFCTGPDGIDEVNGVAKTLGECFENIITCETMNLYYITFNNLKKCLMKKDTLSVKSQN